MGGIGVFGLLDDTKLDAKSPLWERCHVQYGFAYTKRPGTSFTNMD